MSDTHRVAVVLAGGSGERFWPVSVPTMPKQLLRLTNPGMSMLEEAVRRIEPLVGDDGVFVSTSIGLADWIINADVVPAAKVLSEPAKRNTLGAFVWVAAQLTSLGLKDATLAVITADHKIDEPDQFRRTVGNAMDAAEREGTIVTIGIVPTRPETGFGYIKARTDLPHSNGNQDPYYTVERFHEKPSLISAHDFIQDPQFYWNSGMFFFTLPTFVKTLTDFQPTAAEVYREIVGFLVDGNEVDAARAFERLPNISFDYAVMERVSRVHMVPASFPWDDVGAWDAMDRILAKDNAGNVQQGPSFLIDSKNCIVVNHDESTGVGILGADSLVVVHTPTGLLVCPKALAQRVKELPAAMARAAGK